MLIVACSVGIMDPTWVKALIISDGAGNTFVSVTIDAIGADNSLNFMAYAVAQGMVRVDLDALGLFCSRLLCRGSIFRSRTLSSAPAIRTLAPVASALLCCGLSPPLLTLWYQNYSSSWRPGTRNCRRVSG
jgi:hypothetical protein